VPDDNIPFACKQPSTPPTNAEFLTALTRRVPERIDGQIPYFWVTAFPGDPNEVGEWRGRPAFRPLDKYLPPTDAGLNTFYTVSAFVPGKDGRISRAKQCFGALFVLVIDDLGDGLGGKIPWSRVAGRLPPSYILETSLGSYQMGYILTEPVTDRLRAESLIDAMTYQGIGAQDDPGMLGVTRNVRLAQGLNGKLKYREQGCGFLPPLPIEQAPRHRLVHWSPETTYPAEQLIWDYGLDLSRAAVGAGAGFRGTPGATPEDDPWYPVWSAAGLLKGAPIDKAGAGVWVETTCPNLAEHTDGADNGSAYCLGSGQAGGYRCHHGHCDELDWPAVRARFLRGDFGAEVRQLAANAYAEELFGAEGIAAVDAHIERVRAERAAHTPGPDGDDTPPAGPAGPAGPPAARAPVDPAAVRAWAMGAFPQREHLDLSDAPTIEQLVRAMAASHPEIGKPEREPIFDLVKDRTKQSITTIRDAYDAARKAQQRAWDAEDEAWAAQEALYEEQQGPRLDSQGFLRRPFIRDNEWVSTDGDSPICNVSNVSLLLQRSGGVIRHNDMTQAVELGGVFENKTLDYAVTCITGWCSELKLKNTQHSTVLKVLQAIAADNSYHPFVDFLDSVEWDGVERIQRLIDVLPVAPEDEEIRNVVVRKWLYSVIAAARWMYKDLSGGQPRGVLTLRGVQRAGKTTFFQRLFENLFPNSSACFISGRHFDGTADSRLELLGALVAELGEVDATVNRAETGQLKAFLSAERDRIRKPYAYSHQDVHRRTVFSGSVNVNFLRDASGNTRFWALNMVGHIDLDAMQALDMPQIWAELDHMCAERFKHRGNGSKCFVPWHLTDLEMKQVEERNESHRVVTEVEELILDSFEWQDEQWLAAKARYERTGGKDDLKAWLDINPMTMRQIVALISGRPGAGTRSTEAYRAPLSRLTGLPKAAHRSAWVKDATGKGRTTSGRYWPMPPLAVASGAVGVFAGVGEQTEEKPAVTVH